MVDKALVAVEGHAEPRIVVLGAAFKPQSDDVRDSPALWIAGEIHRRGIQVVVHDPRAIPSARARFPDLTYAHVLEEALTGADLVLHLTEWQEYRSLDPASVRAMVRTPLLIDGRNLLDIEAWRASGWTVQSMGRP